MSSTAIPDDDAKAALTPPYVSFLTFKTLLKSFQENGTPGRIDRTVLPNFSGSVAGQLIPALRFLKLIDPRNHPTDALRNLVKSYGTDDFATDLKIVLEIAYGALVLLDLQSASPSQFDEAFSSSFPGAENVLRKSKTFYLAAVTEAKIPVGPYIMKNKKPRSGPAKKRVPKPDAGKKNEDGKGGAASNQNNQTSTSLPLSQQLLAALDMIKMAEAEQNAVWTLIKYFAKEGK